MCGRILVCFLANMICLTIAFDFEYTLGHIKPQVNAADQAEAVLDLIKRVIPEQADKFIISIDVSIGPIGKDTFHVEKIGDHITISATSGVAAASGFHHYLKYYCQCHISWTDSQLNIPVDLPPINLTITSNDRFRYYQNVCTTSYSFVWWDWPKWEKHIDWMALNSINLVLAFNGQEAIWERVYQQLGLTQNEIDEHFSGPAFLSWNRMGNMRGFGGPLSKAWHTRSLILQKQILNRMRAFGITPVLPAFAGQVPKAFKRLYPNTKMYPLPVWNKFNDSYCCPYLLEPTEPLFKTVGKLFLNELISEIGTDHVYNCDTFNEMTPSTGNTTYLKNIGQSIYAAMTDVDAQAIWIMQNWLFLHEFLYWNKKRVEALLTSVPIGKMIILDLQSEQYPQYGRLQSYFGQPYIWCMLHNFGGTLGMFGSSDIINERVFEARQTVGSTMIGTGLTPEGINQNYVIYDLMSEMAWRKNPTNLTNWFSLYATRRYGLKNENVIRAWDILRDTVYNFKSLRNMRGKFAINRSPRTKIDIWTWYEHSDLIKAVGLFLDRGNDFKNSLTYQHDLVDMARQMYQNFGDLCYIKFIDAFNNKNVERFQYYSDNFMKLFPQLEIILGSNKDFLLGSWLNDAKAAADNKDDEALFEYNARNQITLWGPKGEIKDYANKQWSGMVSAFFEPRWSLFIKHMNDSLVNQVPFKESEVTKLVFKQVEEPFTYDRTPFPNQPIGDTHEIVKELFTTLEEAGHLRVERSGKFKTIEQLYSIYKEMLPEVLLVD